MGKAKRASTELRRRFAEISDMPKEIIADYSRMILMGNREFTIENYNGIIEYEEHKIRLGTAFGIICVTGLNLSINELDNDELLVTGRIKSIEFESEE